VLEIAEGLLQLDPVRTYPPRGAGLVAQLAGASGWKLELHEIEILIVSDPPAPDGCGWVELPLRNGRKMVGRLHLGIPRGDAKLGKREARLARWGARVLARGLAYSQRLAAEGVRRAGEDVGDALERAPLTPRERDVVEALLAGGSTPEIAERTGLTVATVSTYLKRIFAKLGVRSRVELVARLAGTEGSRTVR
jgi:DNA-binding CsgD family transcriptional regulator